MVDTEDITFLPWNHNCDGKEPHTPSNTLQNYTACVFLEPLQVLARELKEGEQMDCTNEPFRQTWKKLAEDSRYRKVPTR